MSSTKVHSTTIEEFCDHKRQKMKRYMLYVCILLIVGYIIGRICIQEYTSAIWCTVAVVATMIVIYASVTYIPERYDLDHLKRQIC